MGPWERLTQLPVAPNHHFSQAHALASIMAFLSVACTKTTQVMQSRGFLTVDGRLKAW